jgi:chromosomal replication initiation ATPase DnaA
MIKPEQIIEAVADYLNTTPEAMRSKYRGSELIKARRYAMYLIIRECGMTLAATGAFFGKDHATALFHKRKMEQWTIIYPEVRDDIEEITHTLHLSTNKIYAAMLIGIEC